MNNTNIIRLLNVVAVIAATFGGASAVPDLNLPKAVLAYGLFIAMVCKAVAAELVQVKGMSDEKQGIDPASSALSAALTVHTQASTPPTVRTNPTTGVTTITPALSGEGQATMVQSVKSFIVGFSILALGMGMTCKVASGSDPIVVRTEQAETLAYGAFDEFLKLDDVAMANTNIAPVWSNSAHPFATYLRKPILNGTNMVPFGIATILSLDQIKLAYEAGTATSNALATAISTLTATVAQASQYNSLISTNK